MADKELFFKEMLELIRRAEALRDTLKTGRRTDAVDREYLSLTRLQKKLLDESVTEGIKADATPEWQGYLPKMRSCLVECDAFYETQDDLPNRHIIH